jgi:lipid-binding SYLF domain-containing protein
MQRQSVSRTISITSRILHQMSYDPVTPISKELLDHAMCVSVSRVWSASVIWGGQGSLDSVISCRTQNGWSAPAFSNFGGPSFGAQIGFSTTDVVHLYMNESISNQLKRNNRLSFGVGISAVAGSVGLDYRAVVERGIDVVVYASRSGLAAGIAAEANWIGNAPRENQYVYNTQDKAVVLSMPGSTAPEVVQPFVKIVTNLCP